MSYREVGVLSHIQIIRKFIFRSTMQQATNLQLSTYEFKDTFVSFDAEICHRLNSNNHICEVSKPIPQNWVDILELYTKFSEYFNRVLKCLYLRSRQFYTGYALRHICGHGDSTAKILRSYQVFQSKKFLQDASCIPIGGAHEKFMLDTRVYQVKYPD